MRTSAFNRFELATLFHLFNDTKLRILPIAFSFKHCRIGPRSMEFHLSTSIVIHLQPLLNALFAKKLYRDGRVKNCPTELLGFSLD